MAICLAWEANPGYFLLLALPTVAENVKVVNGSEWGIYHFFLAPADSDQWGPDQLRGAFCVVRGGEAERPALRLGWVPFGYPWPE